MSSCGLEVCSDINFSFGGNGVTSSSSILFQLDLVEYARPVYLRYRTCMSVEVATKDAGKTHIEPSSQGAQYQESHERARDTSGDLRSGQAESGLVSLDTLFKRHSTHWLVVLVLLSGVAETVAMGEAVEDVEGVSVILNTVGVVEVELEMGMELDVEGVREEVDGKI